MELAAIATAAVPGLSPVGVAGIPDDPDDFDSALIIDGQKNRWRVRSPRHEEASMRLETELTALRSFTPGIRAALPFRLPSVAGTVRQGSLRTFVYNHLPGSVMDLGDLVASGGSTAADIGRIIAAVHALPEELVDRADLPVYTADEFRQRRLNELDQAATTGRIPPRLLRRWEHALEDIALWRFNPRVVHGDLHEENLLLDDGKVAAVTGWTDVRIGDPADDFAWLAAAHEQSFTDTVIEAYTAARGELADPHIMRRAALAAEFALAQWFTRGLATNDADRIVEGEQMLRDLDEDIAEFGGQPISIVDPPRMDIHGRPLPEPAPEAADPEATGIEGDGPADAEAATTAVDDSDAAEPRDPAPQAPSAVPPHPSVPPKTADAPVSHWGPAQDEPAPAVAEPADQQDAPEETGVSPEPVEGQSAVEASTTEPPASGIVTDEDASGEDASGEDDGPAFLRDIDVADDEAPGASGEPAQDATAESPPAAPGDETDAIPLILIDPEDGSTRPAPESGR